MSQRKLDLFKLLGKLSQKDWEYVQTLSEEELKEIAPFVIMRWLSGTHNAEQVYLLNLTVNPFLFCLQKHKILLFQLMTIATSGHTQKYVWNKLPGKQATKPLSCAVVCEYYGYSRKQAYEVLPLLKRSDILDYAQDLGWQNEEIKKLTKELTND